MNIKLNKVQIIITIIVVIVVLIAIGVLSGRLPGLGQPGSRNKVELTMWGTISDNVMLSQVSELSKTFPNLLLNYKQKQKDSFESELINALATGQGPDLVIFPYNLILKQSDKFFSIPESFLTERDFRDIFSDGSEILIFGNGILGLPLAVDPLVLYWNKDLFRNEGITSPPKTWDEFLVTSQALTKIDNAGNIIQSGSALGLASNVENFKEIIALLILQTGNPVAEGPPYQVVFNRNIGSVRPAESALRFFTEFSNPQKASYSWSPSQTNSKEAFSRGTLATYFGFASEFGEFKEKNPHINFDIASVPQIRGGNLTLTFGTLTAIGITQRAQNFEAAYQAAQFMTSKEAERNIALGLEIAPSRRDLLSERGGGPTLEVIRKEAIRFRSWPDIDPEKTTEIFRNMIQSAYSGRKSTSDATEDAQIQLNNLFNNRQSFSSFRGNGYFNRRSFLVF